ncbi:response regulator [Tateyamaria omphalii]|uniref:response regulator transcription factor n=1 Tax=Tateyamaria omphalii TaxID=299262 RepID=UPI001C991E67|nr:response regulator [Tateyamaria omphalii]MBY5935022.1 response regulator [Tateyamaria omphalii]
MDDGQFVFLVDDDADIRGSLARALGLRGYVVRPFASAQDFLENYEQDLSGCLLLDYGMPKMDGLQLQKRLNDMGSPLPVIFITGHGGVPESVEAMKMGAVDFLEKPFKQSVLIERIEAALETDRRRRAVDMQISGIVTRFQSLTDREKEISLLLATRPGQNSSKEIARQLGISPRTVDHHRARILAKMDVATVAELVETSLKAGLVSDHDV